MNIKPGDRILYGSSSAVMELVVVDVSPSEKFFLGVTQRFEVATAMLAGPNARIFRGAMHSPDWYPISGVVEVLAPQTANVQVS